MTTGRVYRQQTVEQRRADRRARLLDAALDAFGTAGYQATAIEQLCADAGVSTRNFYEEFPSKEAVLIELHDQLNARAFDAVVAALVAADSTDLTAWVAEGLRAYFTVMTSDPRWARIAIVESVGVSPRVEQHRRAAIDRFTSLLEAETKRLAAAGRVPDRDYHLTAIAVIGAIYGLINSWTTRTDWDAVLDEVVAEGARFLIAAITFDA